VEVRKAAEMGETGVAMAAAGVKVRTAAVWAVWAGLAGRAAAKEERIEAARREVVAAGTAAVGVGRRRRPQLRRCPS
jgi:hypothetical protein